MPTHYVDELSAVTAQSGKASSVRITTRPCCAKHVLRPQRDGFYQVDDRVATIGMQSRRTYRERAMRNEGLTPDVP